MVQIVTLADKLYAGLISRPIFDRQLRQICPIKKIDWETVVRLYEDSLPKHDSPHAGGVICPKSDTFGIGSACSKKYLDISKNVIYRHHNIMFR